jgi:hypothetical protein
MDWVPGRTWGWLDPSGSLCNELFIIHQDRHDIIKADVEQVKEVQGSQGELLSGLQFKLAQQQLQLNNIQRERFFSGVGMQKLLLGPTKVSDKADPKAAVVSMLAAAAVKKKPQLSVGVEGVKQQLMESLGRFVVMPVKKKPGMSRVKFDVISPALAKSVWDSKGGLERQVYLDVDLSPIQRSNRMALWQAPGFAQLHKVAQVKNIKRSWVYDEFCATWVINGVQQRVFYHAAYPNGLLANGLAAPANPFVSATAAAAAGGSA